MPAELLAGINYLLANDYYLGLGVAFGVALAFG
jgi:hypothetical protein